MLMGHDKLLLDIQDLVSNARDRVAALQGVAEVLRSSGNYRWVGIYDVDGAAGTVANIVWSGPGAPEYPKFPITKGLTGAAISSRKTVNVGDVVADPRYLTAFGTTSRKLLFPCSTVPARALLARLTLRVTSRMPLAKTYRPVSKTAPV
jgi:putative methionine-R-sulfoxide reductase with GAF domain